MYACLLKDSERVMHDPLCTGVSDKTGNTQFMTVYWGEAALLWQAYNGLAKWIKNEMVHHDKPTTLSNYKVT